MYVVSKEKGVIPVKNFQGGIHYVWLSDNKRFIFLAKAVRDKMVIFRYSNTAGNYHKANRIWGGEPVRTGATPSLEKAVQRYQYN